jgi:prevent-host-death family protein
MAIAGFGFADERPANPVARIFMETANVSPSPWGEGRDEGGCEPFEISHRKLFYWTPDVRFPSKNRSRRVVRLVAQKSRPVVYQNKCPNRACAGVKSVYFSFMEATLTELRRDTSRVVRAADNGEDVILTEHGEPRYRLQRVRSIDRKAAAAALRAIGPVTFLPRK